MARVLLALHVEIELLEDAISEIERVHRALARRHGDAFRALDRRIEIACETGAEPDIRSLGADRLIALPPVEWREIIAEATRLGV